MSRTLEEARWTWFNHTIKGDGGKCPCCDRYGKEYRRPINKTMAGSMVWMAEHAPAGGEWVDVPRRGPRFMVASNQFTLMKWWGLCERNAPTEDEDKKHSGRWRMTERGMDWVANRIAIPKYVWTYNDEVQNFEGPDVRISDIVENFSYSEIMSTRFRPSRRNDPDDSRPHA